LKSKIAKDEFITKSLTSLTANNVDINILQKLKLKNKYCRGSQKKLKLLPDKSAVVYPEV